MRWIILLVFIAAMIAPSMADADVMYITTAYNSPTQYLIDYGDGTTPYLFNYSISASTDLPALNQSWLVLASNNQSTITTIDQQTGINFTAGSEQNFTVTSPGNYRFYYLVLEDGFYNSSTILTLTLYTTSVPAPVPVWMPVIAPVGAQTVQEKTGWDAWIENNQTGIMILIVCILVLVVWKRL